jgi:hypothetical protein
MITGASLIVLASSRDRRDGRADAVEGADRQRSGVFS